MQTAHECQLASINKPTCQGSYWISVQIYFSWHIFSETLGQHFKIPTALSPQEDKAEFQKSPVRGRPNVATSMDIDSTWWCHCGFLGIICFDYPASGQQIGSQKADAQHHWWYADGHQPCGVAAVGDVLVIFLVVAMGLYPMLGSCARKLRLHNPGDPV